MLCPSCSQDRSVIKKLDGRRLCFGCNAELPISGLFPKFKTPDIQPYHKRAIVTWANGVQAEVLAATRPGREAYARKVRADLIELTDDQFPAWPMANKWRVSNIAELYHRTLWLDADVWVSPKSPNVFKRYRKDQWAVYNELPDLLRINCANDYLKAQERSLKSLKLDCPDWTVNGGVLLIPRKLASIYHPPEIEFPSRYWCIDQYYLSAKLEQLGSWDWLDRRFNYGWMAGDFWHNVKSAWFVHLNGTTIGTSDQGYRLELVKRFNAGNFSRLDPPRGRWQPPRIPDEPMRLELANASI